MAIKGKKVFVVFGSEDGDLGVYSNVKLARQAAIDYLCQNGELERDCRVGTTRLASASYNTVRLLIKDYRACTITTKDNTSATITEFGLNE